jgi:hypothetical protein
MSDTPRPGEAPSNPDDVVKEPPKPADHDAPAEEPPGTSEPPTQEPPAGPDEVDPPVRDPRVPGQPTRKDTD